MKTWYLPPPYTQDDITWCYNSCEMEDVSIEIDRPYNYPDSGWCDMATGSEIITNQHKIYIHTYEEKGEMWTLLKYQGRVELRYSSADELNIDDITKEITMSQQ